MIGSLKRSSGAENNNTETGINRIVEGTIVEGTINSGSNLRIDGEFKGNLITKGRLVVGLKGKVSGTVNCLCCDVEGTLEGDVTVLELLSMKSSSTVQGELYYGQLSVEAGAKALGTFRMGVSEGKQVNKQVNKQPQKTASKADALASLKASTMPSESSSLLIDEVTVGAE
ncbi:MAG: polymer-forming cytoskeletal protein [Bacteroidetes bacterium]|jgi:cytoskeletal protein CcmA (bactofilin family)|nr:polymer-forming cytoskeletal protein [Bacteroidota bacterium]MDA0981040.1 polymer-forming cytoskeletal protein [Bacteroidota bacterium]